VLASLAAAAAIALCPATAPLSPLPDPDAPAPDALVACVGTDAISGELFSHWLLISRKGSEAGAPAERVRLQVMEFLVSGLWLEDEAAERRIVVSDRAVRRQLNRQKHASFPSERAFRQFLEDSGMTRSDLKYRVRLDILSERVRKAVSGKGSPKVRERRLARFVTRFRAKWTARTSCRAEYEIKSCGSTLATSAQ
jgi:SurA N-terminal domain